MSRWSMVFLLLAGLGGSFYGRAQTEAERSGLCFSAVAPDVGGGYTIPIAHGSYADLEIVSTSDVAGLFQVTVYDDAGVLRSRGSGVLIPRRVVLASDALREQNLLSISPAVTVEITTDVPVNVVAVRGD